jgi:hypothetical protein
LLFRTETGLDVACGTDAHHIYWHTNCANFCKTGANWLRRMPGLAFRIDSKFSTVISRSVFISPETKRHDE